MAQVDTRGPRARYGFALLLCLLAFAIRVYRLDYQSFHYDEYFSVSLASNTLGEILSRLTLDEPHPPLYYSLLHIWTALAGGGAFAAKFLSLFFGTLVIPLGYRCGREVGGTATGLVAALLLALNPFQFYHAQETRMYSTFEALALASSFFFLALLRRDSRLLWLGYVASTIMAAAAHYEMLLLVAAQVAFVLAQTAFAGMGPLRSSLFRSARRDSLRSWACAWATIALLYLPWLVAARGIAFEYKTGQARPFVWPDSAIYALNRVQETFVAFNFHEVNVPFAGLQLTLLAALALGGVVVALVLPKEKGQRVALWYLIVWALVPMGLALAMDLRRPVFAVRYMVFVSPALAIAFGLAAARLAPWSRPAAVTLVLALSLAYGNAAYALYTDRAYARADLRGVFSYLANVARPGDALLLDCSYQEWAAKYYFRDRLPAFGFPLPEAERPVQDERLAQLSSQYNRLWLVLGGYTACDPYRDVERGAAKVAFKAGERPFGGGLLLVQYAGAKMAERSQASQDAVDFGGRLNLMGWSLPLNPVEAGDTLPVRLVWGAQAQPDRDYAMSLRLLNAADQLIAQRDGMPQDGYRPTTSWLSGESVVDNRGLALPAGLPRGDYRLELRVYDAAAGNELTAASTDTAITATSLVLGHVSVLPETQPVPLETIPGIIALDRRAGALSPVGYRREGPPELRPGQQTRFTVYWRSAEPNTSERPGFQMVLEGLDGQPVQRRSFKRIEDLYPVADWQPGGITRLDYDFVVAPTVPAGRYRLRGHRLLAGSEQELIDEPVTVRNDRPLPRTSESEIANPLPVTLRQGVLFLGYRVRAQEDAPGSTLQVTLYWSTERALSRDYTVFVHALDAAGNIVAQEDTPPARGTHPTSLWVEGEVVRDEHLLKLPNQQVDHMVVGLYLPTTGERLCLVGEGTSCAGDSITIPGPFGPLPAR